MTKLFLLLSLISLSTWAAMEEVGHDVEHFLTPMNSTIVFIVILISVVAYIKRKP